MRPPSYKRKFRVEYCALKNAIDRCTRTTHPQYHDYGGRGLTVDPEFLCPHTGLVTFLADVGAKPHPSLTLERIDNALGYVKGNLTWTDRTSQLMNRRASVAYCRDLGWGIGLAPGLKPGTLGRRHPSPLIPLDDRTQTLAEWARELGIQGSTIRQRLQRGLSPAQALDPNGTHKRHPSGPTVN